MDSIILTKGHQFQSKFGHYKHDSMVGVLYGSKVSLKHSTAPLEALIWLYWTFLVFFFERSWFRLSPEADSWVMASPYHWWICFQRAKRTVKSCNRTLALPHRTQILYLPDIAFITSYLDIKAGSKVVEAGNIVYSYAKHLSTPLLNLDRLVSFFELQERVVAPSRMLLRDR